MLVSRFSDLADASAFPAFASGRFWDRIAERFGPIAQWRSRGLIIPWLQVRVLLGPPSIPAGGSPRARAVSYGQPETPRAVARRVRRFGEAAEAFASDALVDAAGELAVLHLADALAGMESHALALARVLHAAIGDAVDERAVFVEAELVGVGRRLAAQRQRASEACEPRMLFQAEERFDAARLDLAEAPPRLHVVAHGGVHALAPLKGLEPRAVERDEVLGVDDEQLFELVSGKRAQSVVHVAPLFGLRAFVARRKAFRAPRFSIALPDGSARRAKPLYCCVADQPCTTTMETLYEHRQL